MSERDGEKKCHHDVVCSRGRNGDAVGGSDESEETVSSEAAKQHTQKE